MTTYAQRHNAVRAAKKKYPDADYVVAAVPGGYVVHPMTDDAAAQQAAAEAATAALAAGGDELTPEEAEEFLGHTPDYLAHVEAEAEAMMAGADFESVAAGALAARDGDHAAALDDLQDRWLEASGGNDRKGCDLIHSAINRLEHEEEAEAAARERDPNLVTITFRAPRAEAERVARMVADAKGEPVGMAHGEGTAPRTVEPRRAKPGGPRPSKAPADPTEKPAITSPTNQVVARLIDRIEAARGDREALARFAFKPSNTYYATAHRYLEALRAEAEAR